MCSKKPWQCISGLTWMLVPLPMVFLTWKRPVTIVIETILVHGCKSIQLLQTTPQTTAIKMIQLWILTNSCKFVEGLLQHCYFYLLFCNLYWNSDNLCMLRHCESCFCGFLQMFELNLNATMTWFTLFKNLTKTKYQNYNTLKWHIPCIILACFKTVPKLLLK